MLAVMITAGASAAYAQIVATFDASFAFRLGTSVHQPGKYEVRMNDDLLGVTLVPAKGASLLALVVTRLAEPEPALADAKLVFPRTPW